MNRTPGWKSRSEGVNVFDRWPRVSTAEPRVPSGYSPFLMLAVYCYLELQIHCLNGVFFMSLGCN